MTARYRKPTQFYLPPALRERLEQRAEQEARTVSKMGEILLAQALGVAGGGDDRASVARTEPDPREGRKRASRTKDAGVAPVSPPATPRAARTTVCEHRIPADAFCARCD